MKRAAFQCPDSGLIVIVRADGQVEGDPDDWSDMGASEETIKATWDWIYKARAVLARVQHQYGPRGKRLSLDLIEHTLRPLGVHADDLDPLHW